jgi:hypothetical protein
VQRCLQFVSHVITPFLYISGRRSEPPFSLLLHVQYFRQCADMKADVCAAHDQLYSRFSQETLIHRKQGMTQQRRKRKGPLTQSCVVITLSGRMSTPGKLRVKLYTTLTGTATQIRTSWIQEQALPVNQPQNIHTHTITSSCRSN